MGQNLVRDSAAAPRSRIRFTLGLLSALILGGWSDCCRNLEVQLADPFGYGPRSQPFRYNAYYLHSFDGGAGLGTRTATIGYSPKFLYGDTWAEFPRLSYQGKSLYVTSVVRENDDLAYVGSQLGLLGWDRRYGTVEKFAGLPESNPGIWSLCKRSQGGVFAGRSYASGAGEPLVYSCQMGSSGNTCTPASGGPLSTKAGDRTWKIKDFGGAYYALTSIGMWSSPNGINYFKEGTPNINNCDIGGEDGNLVAAGSFGAYKGPGRGQPWTMDNMFLGQGCAGVAYLNSRFYVACNYPSLQVFTRPKTEPHWTSTGLSSSSYGFDLKVDNGDLILGTTVGPMRYRNSSWSLLDDCLKRSYSALSVAAFSQTLAVGGDLTGYSESTDQGKTWTLDPSTYRVSARYTLRNNLGTYFTGDTGTFYRPTGQTAFQKLTIPTGYALSLGQAGDTVLAGLVSGGVGRLSGTTFTPANAGFDMTASVYGFASSGNSIVALSNKGNWFAPNAASPSWNKGANRADGQPFIGYRGIGLRSGDYLLGGFGNPSGWNIAISNPAGTTLTRAGLGIPDGSTVYDLAEAPDPPAPAPRNGGGTAAFAAASPTLFAATSNGLYVSFDGATSWSLLSKALGTAPVFSLAVDGDRLWVGTSHRGVTSYALPIRFRRLVPVVLDVTGGSVHFTTELVLTNPGAAAVDMSLQYTASLGSGSGTVAGSIGPGQQLVIPDAIAYLRGKGLSIPQGGSQGGTLLLTFSNVSAERLPAVTARTTAETGPPLPIGRAGLAYGALDPEDGTGGALTVYGLRSNAADRSSLAVFNTSNEATTVKVTAWSGAGDGASAVIAASDELPAWGWKQYNRILDGPGIAQGWVTVERVSTTGSFSIYGVINDNVTNDGSLIQPGSNPSAPSYVNVPVLVEAGGFGSELVLANSDSVAAVFRLEYTESLAGAGGGSTNVNVPAKSQLVIPDAIAYLRSRGVSIGAAGAGSYAGSLHVEVSGASPAATYVGARTSAPAAAGGEFGLFTPAFTPGAEGEVEATINGLRSDPENRSNVAVANTGGPNDGSITLSLQAYDGDSVGAPKGAPVLVTLAPGRWQQLNNFLGSVGASNGWVKVTRMAGVAPWIAYGVVNDGGAPGQRTSDGAYVAMVK